MTTAQRPVGVTILAIIAFIFGILGLIPACGSLLGAGVVGSEMAGFLLVHGLVTLVTSGLQIVFAGGAWTLKPWAWIAGVALQIITLLTTAIYLALGAELVGQLFSIVPALAILAYLLTPAIRQAFGRGNAR